MAVEEHRRIRLFERLTSLLGREDAITLLEMLPPPGRDVLTIDDLRRELADVVRKADLRDVVRKSDLRDVVRKADLEDVVRKADLEDVVRKDDLGNVVRKGDIRDFVRKDDLSHYATKADLYRAFTALAAVVAGIEVILG